MKHCTVVTKDNVEEIRRILRRVGGRILIAEPLFFNQARIHLFGQPHINQDWLETKRGTKDVGGRKVQTGWEDDRLYLLRPKDIPKNDNGEEQIHALGRSCLESLEVGPTYELQISFQTICSMGLFSKGTTTLYAPLVPINIIGHALGYVLGNLTNQINEEMKAGGQEANCFDQAHILTMIRYMINDLKTGKVLSRNVHMSVAMDF